MNVLVAVILALVTYALRIAEHPWNVAPTAAAMLFAGAVLPRRWGWIAPLVGSLAADAVIGFDAWQITTSIALVYAAMWGAGALLARWERRSLGSLVRRNGVIAIAGSVLFYLVTNWAVWMWSPLYAPTWSGLVRSYAMGIPFFRNTLLGDLLFTAVFFGCYAAAAWGFQNRAALLDRRVPVRVEE